MKNNTGVFNKKGIIDNGGYFRKSLNQKLHDEMARKEALEAAQQRLAAKKQQKENARWSLLVTTFIGAIFIGAILFGGWIDGM